MNRLTRYLFPALLLWPAYYSTAQSAGKATPATTSAVTSGGPQFFIDKFVVPANAVSAFKERVRLNRALIRELPGFIEDHAYEQTDEQGNLTFITVAAWASREALQEAKKAVQAAYQKEGFDPLVLLERLHIKMERGVFVELP